MINTVRTYIYKHQLLQEGNQPVLVGLSGGADSVTLLAILVRLGYSCIAAHCNFHLREEESNRDEAFAKSLAQKLDVPFYKIDFKTEQYASENHLSIEMAARELRYQWFDKLGKELNVQAIAVAHHQDDNAETLLINLIRGTGIRGVRGIKPKNNLIVRPLLDVTRKEILEWLKDQQLSFVTDSTNLSDIYTRNFIRLRVLPLLEEINPSAKNALARSAEHLSDVENIYLSVIEKAKQTVFVKDTTLSITELLKYPSPATILFELLKPFHFTRIVSEAIYESLDKESGKQFFSATHRLIKDRDQLLLSPTSKKQSREEYTLSTEEEVWDKPIELSCKKMVINEKFNIEKSNHIAYFDYNKLTFPLTIRTWKPGDWFIPFGMKGRKKLSDYFTDKKFSIFEKEKVWLLCSGEDILWIIGERTDNRYRIEKSTTQVLIVKKMSKIE